MRPGHDGVGGGDWAPRLQERRRWTWTPGRLGGVALLLLLVTLGGGGAATAQESATLSCKSFPPGYFVRELSPTPAKRQALLARIARELTALNDRGECLIVKGTMLEPPDTRRQVYDKITILDDSGLKVVVRKVPNLYYGYPGPPERLNRNVYLVARRLELKELESRLSESFIIEGEFVAYAGKYLEALRRSLEPAEAGENR
ncbi:MAG: hypothetical protein WHT07_13235 [Desulfobaccales bacterium]